MNRESGYYWVDYGEGWQVASYDGCGSWHICGDENTWEEELFDEIDERQIIRGKSIN